MSRVNWWAVIAGCALVLILALTGAFMARPGGFIVIPEAPEKAIIPAEIVAVTPSGAKYHRESCSSLNNSPMISLMTPEEAAAAGYEPCQRCKPR